MNELNQTMEALKNVGYAQIAAFAIFALILLIRGRESAAKRDDDQVTKLIDLFGVSHQDNKEQVAHFLTALEKINLTLGEVSKWEHAMVSGVNSQTSAVQEVGASLQKHHLFSEGVTAEIKLGIHSLTDLVARLSPEIEAKIKSEVTASEGRIIDAVKEQVAKRKTDEMKAVIAEPSPMEMMAAPAISTTIPPDAATAVLTASEQVGEELPDLKSASLTVPAEGKGEKT